MSTVIRFISATVFSIAGVLHFLREQNFTKIVPSFLPFKKFLVWITGIIEILFGVLLFIKRPGKLLKNIINVFLLLVLPANIYMARKEVPLGDIQLPKPVLWGRIPLQFVMIKMINKM